GAESLAGPMVGKAGFGLKVISHGWRGRVDPPLAIGRLAASLLSDALLLLGSLSMMWDPAGRTLADRVTGTAVVPTRDRDWGRIAGALWLALAAATLTAAFVGT